MVGGSCSANFDNIPAFDPRSPRTEPCLRRSLLKQYVYRIATKIKPRISWRSKQPFARAGPTRRRPGCWAVGCHMYVHVIGRISVVVYTFPFSTRLFGRIPEYWLVLSFLRFNAKEACNSRDQFNVPGHPASTIVQTFIETSLQQNFLRVRV